ncbi:MAG: hypothetical protein MRJ67_06740 [Nitrospirales bacterium]|nr:hypothetical protein [Nitrospirales bacterium]
MGLQPNDTDERDGNRLSRCPRRGGGLPSTTASHITWQEAHRHRMESSHSTPGTCEGDPMYRLHALCLCALLLTGCSSHIKDTDVLSSNSGILPPATGKTDFLQNRNASDNQPVALSDLGSRLG